MLATLLPFIRSSWWWVRVCDFPRLQLFVLGLAVLAALLALAPDAPHDWLAVALLASAVLYQGYRILPYSPLWSVRALPSQDPDPDRKLRLLIANVLVGNRRTEPLLNLVRATDPDVLLALETTASGSTRSPASNPDSLGGSSFPRRTLTASCSCPGSSCAISSCAT